MSQTYAGFAAIVGAPNAGKSTLTNALVGEKISIVTHKVQTTRFQIRGIAMLETSKGAEAQAVMIDTPGIFEAKESDRLSKSMVHAAWTGMNDADIIVHVIDAPAWLRHQNGEGSGQDRLSREDSERVIKGLKKREIKNAILALNKIDEIAHDEILPLIQHFSEQGVYSDILPVSALNFDGVKRLGLLIADAMPSGPFLYSPDQAADIPMRLMAAEITREKLFLRLHDELPYASTVETEAWKELKSGDVRVEQVIYVKRDSQKPIVLGKNGRTIKDIGASARKEMSDWLGRKVHLFIFVKVRDNWQNDRARYSESGLEFDV
ncbi:GTP-binding protein Era [Litorimonas taeanensis]|uniref:GTPase Era n=1 Tax=Litorimonas taeanensis TaxID=568099 RepID=A0A420WKB8_9PROT|nr:GTPase Era [Litorimonas taeanensis]RKQ71448.1 GTP-binding protein Era [Litorimonas taeanensis]